MVELKIPVGRKTKPNIAFDTANSFFEGAIRCATPVNDPYIPGGIVAPTSPTVSSIAFAAELYLKAIIGAEAGTAPNVHRLDKLFSILSDDCQKQVRKRYCEISGSQSLQMKKHLLELSNAFVEWRYSHEGTPQVRQDRLFYLARALYETARQIHPEWSVNTYLHERLIADPPDGVQQVMSMGGGTMIRTNQKNNR